MLGSTCQAGSWGAPPQQAQDLCSALGAPRTPWGASGPCPGATSPLSASSPGVEGTGLGVSKSFHADSRVRPRLSASAQMNEMTAVFDCPVRDVNVAASLPSHSSACLYLPAYEQLLILGTVLTFSLGCQN